MQQKTFSIIIPSYNRPDIIINAVKSALDQCTELSEVILVDDRSSTPVETVLVDIVDSRLKIIRNNKKQGGAAYARNIGVEAANNELVFFLDDDDVFFGNYIQYVLADHNLDHADYGFGKDCLDISKCQGKKNINAGFTLIKCSDHLKKRVAGVSTGFWIKRFKFLEINGFDTQQTIDEDTDLCVRLTISGSNCLVYKGYSTIRNYHSHEVSQLTKNTEKAIVLACYEKTFDKSVEQLAKSTNGVWYLGSRYIRRAVNMGAFKEAYNFCLKQQRKTLKYKLLFLFYKKKFSFSLKKLKVT